MKIDFAGIIGLIVLSFMVGMMIQALLDIEQNVEGFTLVKNQSNDWYWLENQEYTRIQLSELYTLKSILISNECIDGGFIENIDGKEFLIVCYEKKGVLKNKLEDGR